jgi:hypothetical protein
MISCILIRCCASGVETNQSSLADIIEEIDVQNKTHVPRRNNLQPSRATAPGLSNKPPSRLSRVGVAAVGIGWTEQASGPASEQPSATQHYRSHSPHKPPCGCRGVARGGYSLAPCLRSRSALPWIRRDGERPGRATEP